jgi:hypothetical protein
MEPKEVSYLQRIQMYEEFLVFFALKWFLTASILGMKRKEQDKVTAKTAPFEKLRLHLCEEDHKIISKHISHPSYL